MSLMPSPNAEKYANGTTRYEVRDEVTLLREMVQMPDCFPAYMVGGQTVQPWVIPVYGIGAEIELIDMLYAMVRLLRPRLIVETGCHLGFTTWALGKAAQHVEESSVVSCDTDEAMVTLARNRCSGLPVAIEHCSCTSAAFTAYVSRADFLFLDAEESTRAKNFSMAKTGAIVINHNTRGESFADEITQQAQRIQFDETWKGFTVLRKC